MFEETMMYFAIVTYQIGEDVLAYILIESDSEAGCIEKMVSLLRDVWSKGTYWGGAGGMMESLLLAQEAGYPIYPGAGQGFTELHRYQDSTENIDAGRMLWFYSNDGDDFLECAVGWFRAFGLEETGYRGTLYDSKSGRPDFAALADLVAEIAAA